MSVLFRFRVFGVHGCDLKSFWIDGVLELESVSVVQWLLGVRAGLICSDGFLGGHGYSEGNWYVRDLFDGTYGSK